MSDLKARLSILDSVIPSDVWEEAVSRRSRGRIERTNSLSKARFRALVLPAAAFGLSLAVLFAAFGGVGEKPNVDPLGSGPLLEGTGLVVERPDRGVQLCLGVVFATAVPQCDGLRVEGWNWADVDGEATQGGAAWGFYRVVGHLDDSQFVIERPAQSSAPPQSDSHPQPVTACEEPKDGWDTPDPRLATRQDMQAATQEVEGVPSFAGAWVDDSRGVIILNAAFTDKAESHEDAIRARWGGPLCLIHHDRSLDELSLIQAYLSSPTSRPPGLDVLHSEINVFMNRVEVRVVFANDRMEAQLAKQFGVGAVLVSSALHELP
jgi:hypothetical protein